MKTKIHPNRIFRNFTRLQRTCWLAVFLLTFLLSASSSWGQITQRGSATTASAATTNNKTISINKPSGVVAGDVLIFSVVQNETDNDNGGLASPTLTGWTLVKDVLIRSEGTSNGDNAWFGSIYYRVSDGTEGNTFSFQMHSRCDMAIGSMVAFTGVACNALKPNGTTGGPFDIVPSNFNNANSLTATATGVNVANNGSAIIMFAMCNNDRTYSSWSNSQSELFDNVTTNVDDASLGAAWRYSINSGSTGNGTVTLSGSDRNSAIFLVLRRASAFSVGTPSSTPTLCQNTTLTNITHSTVGATGIGEATGLPSGVSAAWASNNITISGTPSASGTFNYSIPLIGGCGSVDATGTIIVNPIPTAVTSAASVTAVCSGVGFNLTSSATSNNPTAVTLLDENFNATPSGWTTVNNSNNGGTPANAAWILRPSGYGVCQDCQIQQNISSNDASQYYLSNSDAQGSGTTATILQSPTFSTVGLASATLRFFHFYRDYNTTDTAFVEISTNGSSWVALNSYTSNQGGPSAFAEVTADLAAYLNQPTVSIRFRYQAVWSYYWAVDNVTVTGTPTAPIYAWTSTPSGFTSSEQNPSGVTQTAATVYTVTATNFYGCMASASTASVAITPATVGGSVSGAANICAGSNSGLLTLSGHTGSIVRWESAVSPFTTWVPIVNTNTTYTSGSLTETTRFRAIVQSGDCAQASSSSATITVSTPPSAGTLSGTQSVCSNGTTSFTSTVSGGTWTSGNTAVATIDSASGVVTPVAVGTATMIYTVTGTGGCANATATRTVTVTAPPTAGTLSGTQSICSNDTTTFTSTVSGGAWTSGNTAVATINSASGVVTPVAAGTATMTYTVTGTGGCANATATRSVTISSLSVGGSVSGTATICSGTGADLTLSGHVGNVVRWESAVSPFTTWTPIANTATAYNSGALTQETKFRAVVQNGACAEAYSSEATLSFASTTWNGTSWVGGAPAANKTLTIAANYTSPGSNFNLQGCSLTVQNNAVVTIVPQDSVVLSGALTVTTGSTMTFEPQAHLIQSGTTNLNSGAVIVKANSAPIKRLDYTLWSAPVAGQQLQAFSPLTLANRFYNYDSNTNFYTVVPSPSTTSFEAAKGVLIRVANTHSATQPQSWAGTFTGVPNSGTYSIPLANFGPGKRFTLVGNPYPSPIDPEAFINNPNNAAAITGTLYLWRKTNGSNKPSYCTFNLGGFITNGEDHSNNVANLPYQVIQTGQGFFVEGTGSGSGNVVFDNTMRIDDHTNSFLRTANTAHTTNSVERNRVWLNVTNTAGAFSQAMIGYVTNATNGFDMNYDGKYINDGEIALASILNAEPYAIQCKALPFSTSDVIPMQFTATTAGTYSIAVDRVDGLFTSGQAVYLRDTVTGTVHNLSEGAYSFAAESGTFNARFEVVFQASTLGVTDPVLNENQVVIYKTPANEISINTGNFVMDNVMIYDLAGRLLFQQKDINNSQALIKVGFATEVLLVKIKTQDGKSVTKKVLFPRTTLKKDLKISTIQVAEDE